MLRHSALKRKYKNYTSTWHESVNLRGVRLQESARRVSIIDLTLFVPAQTDYIHLDPLVTLNW